MALTRLGHLHPPNLAPADIPQSQAAWAVVSEAHTTCAMASDLEPFDVTYAIHERSAEYGNPPLHACMPGSRGGGRDGAQRHLRHQ